MYNMHATMINQYIIMGSNPYDINILSRVKVTLDTIITVKVHKGQGFQYQKLIIELLVNNSST